MQCLIEDEARAIFRQIILALECLHAHGIAHAKINTTNIFMDDTTKEVKVGDMLVCHSQAPLIRQEQSRYEWSWFSIFCFT